MSEGNFIYNENEKGSSEIVTSGLAAIFTHPDDVSSDPRLGVAEKKAILASWVSDARTVENAPRLRRLDSGAIVEVGAILRALRALDGPPARERPRSWLPFAPHRRSVISSLLRRGRSQTQSGDDDDDDPPPAPAGLAVPFRPTFVGPRGARPESWPAACAAA